MTIENFIVAAFLKIVFFAIKNFKSFNKIPKNSEHEYNSS
jgi:hypothetical protein